MAPESIRQSQQAIQAGVLACLIACCLGWLVPLPALGNADSQKGPLQAAFVYNFCKFVEWPEGENTELVLGLMGASDDTSHFESIAGKTARELAITVKQVNTQDELGACQLVFIAPDQAGQVPGILKKLAGQPVLTISAMEDFCKQGGMIQFVSIQGKMRFYINRTAAENARLSISSQLLKMAKIVEGGAQE